jgi:hypothetical protein
LKFGTFPVQTTPFWKERFQVVKLVLRLKFEGLIVEGAKVKLAKNQTIKKELKIE